MNEKPMDAEKHKHLVCLVNGYTFANVVSLSICPSMPEFVQLAKEDGEHYPLINRSHIWFIGGNIKHVYFDDGEEYSFMDLDFRDRQIDLDTYSRLKSEKEWRENNE